MQRLILLLIILYSLILKSQNQLKIEIDSIISLDEVIIKSNTILGLLSERLFLKVIHFFV